jgi:hypothetical protein
MTQFEDEERRATATANADPFGMTNEKCNCRSLVRVRLD